LSAEQPPGGGSAGAGAGQPPSEEELRAAYEAELSRISATDMIAQSAVSLLNIGARRVIPAADSGEGDPSAGATAATPADLEQARDAIDAARALLEILERRIPQEVAPLRDALSRLQMAYARQVQGGAPAGGGQQPPPGGEGESEEQRPPGPGPAEASGRLWVPGR
jgi:hypothetical protein